MQKIFKELSQKISDSELQFSNLKFSSLLKFKTEILAGLTVENCEIIDIKPLNSND